MFSKLPSELKDFKSDEVILGDEVTLDDLVKAFMEFNKRKYLERPLETVVTRKEYSVSRRCIDIMQRLDKQKQIKFEDLFDIRNRSYVVVTFLAILDLAKKGRLMIRQDRNLEEIFLSSKEEV